MNRIRLFPTERAPVLTRTGVALLALIVPLAILWAVDPRTVDGIGVWRKPLKFALSLGVFAATLAWFTQWAPDRLDAHRAWRAFAAAVCLAIFIEMTWLCTASAMGTRSHFQGQHPFLTAVYPLMGLLATFLASAALVLGIAIARNRNAGLSVALRHGIALGLILTFVLTCAAAWPLASTGGQFGGTPHGPGSTPFGWRTDGSDLRAAHFFATHALHVIPLVAWPVARWLNPSSAVSAVWIAAAGYAGFVVLLIIEALRGLPFLAGVLPG